MILSDDTSRKLSGAIAATRFPLVLMLLFLHGFTAMSIVGRPGFMRMAYPIALWMGETAVPAYFFISGLLMFYSTKTYFQQIKTRFHSLFIPYVIWNGITLAGFLLGYWAFDIDALLGARPISECSIGDLLRAFWDRGLWMNGNGMPVLIPMWYVRNLMILYLISPVIYYTIRLTHLLLPAICCYFWLTEHDIALTMQSLAMFSLGAFFPIIDINPIDLLRQTKYLILALFVSIGAADLIVHLWIATPYNAEIHRLSLITNTFFWMLAGLWLYEHGIQFKRLSKTAFFIYCFHFPINKVVCALIPKYSLSDTMLFGCYLAAVATVTLLCLLAYHAFQQHCPKLLDVATGNRSNR